MRAGLRGLIIADMAAEPREEPVKEVKSPSWWRTKIERHAAVP